MTDLASVKTLLPTSTVPAGVSSLAHVATTAAPAPPRTPAALQKQLDELIADSDTSLRFRVDSTSHRIVVSVLDREGAVILQIPDETALAIARRLAVTGSLLDARA
ncbi:flagellar protein FlaG [Cognatilysobacter terrigena]|uniref:flagellar protein FlaG n=1 Tax=Cognatilysobacter terrigena TaxID=2488749 RepID=UPI00105EBE79|nr:flagellar protein FlaG [Lysobacter terrigena]